MNADKVISSIHFTLAFVSFVIACCRAEWIVRAEQPMPQKIISSYK